MLPWLLLVPGLVLVTAVLFSRSAGASERALPPAPRRKAPGGGAAQWRGLVEQLRGDVPAWVLLGHIAVESGGRRYDNTDNVKCKWMRVPAGGCPPSHPHHVGDQCIRYCCERGLMQATPDDTRKYMSLQPAPCPSSDQSDPQYDPAIAIATGVKLYRHYRDVVKGTARPATDDDLWRMAYTLFNRGTFVKHLVDATRWSEVAARLTAAGEKRWVDANDRLFIAGKRLT